MLNLLVYIQGESDTTRQNSQWVTGCFQSFNTNKSRIQFVYKINDVEFKRVKEIRDLGMCEKCLDPYTPVSISNTYLRSHLEYASIVCCPNYNTHVSNLKSIQKNFGKCALDCSGEIGIIYYHHNRYLLLNIKTLSYGRETTGAFFHLLSSRINSPALLGKVKLIAIIYLRTFVNSLQTVCNIFAIAHILRRTIVVYGV